MLFILVLFMALPFFGKKEENKPSEDSDDVSDAGSGKYNEPCGVCGKQPTDKHWAGQYFHKKCFRKMRKMAKGML